MPTAGYDIPVSLATATPSQATAGGQFSVYSPIIIGGGSSGNTGNQNLTTSPLLNAPATASTAQGGYAGANAPSPSLAATSPQSNLILFGVIGLLVAGGAAYFLLR